MFCHDLIKFCHTIIFKQITGSENSDACFQILLLGALLFSASPSVCPTVHLSVITLNWSFFIGFLPNFIYGFLGFVGGKINKMVNKTAAACRFALVDTLTQSFITLFPPNFTYELLLSKSGPKIKYRFYLMNDNKDGCQNSHRLWSFPLVHTLI